MGLEVLLAKPIFGLPSNIIPPFQPPIFCTNFKKFFRDRFYKNKTYQSEEHVKTKDWNERQSNLDKTHVATPPIDYEIFHNLYKTW